MSMQDPIADMLTRIRNAQAGGKARVNMPASRQRVALAKLLESEGYVAGFSTDSVDGHATLSIDLKYFDGVPVIESIRRVSRPGQRVYRAASDLPRVTGGLGIAVVSTSQGLMSDRAARAQNVGGEIICTVS